MKQRKRHLPPKFLTPLTPCNIPVQRCPVPREKAANRILIMRLGAFGDILMGTPLLAAFRRAYPDAHITWLVGHTEVQAIDANPYIDEYLCWDGAYWKKMLRRGLYPLWLFRALKMQTALRNKHYDIFISFQPEEWPLLLRGIQAPVTIGIFDTFRRYYRATKTSGHTKLYTQAYSYPNLPDHRIDQYLLTLKALGLPEEVSRQMSIGYTVEDRNAAEQFLSENAAAVGDQFVVLVPFTTWPTKCWPSERYVALGNELARRHGCRIVLIGSAKEREAIQALAAQMESRPMVAAGDLTFRQMAALVDKASLLVSGDTGPMHVAAALRIPQIALFGPTAPQWYGPPTGHAISLLHPVPCGPCDQKFCPNVGEDHEICQRLITVEEALASAETLLSERGAVSAAGSG